MPVRDVYGRAWNGAAEVKLLEPKPVSDVQARSEDEFCGAGGAVCYSNLLE